ncbi:amino acid ABC transporter permease [Micromonospora sp. DT4]|uniref:amino acid ABC transporter permease n=1 Tax=Micromonospora sp. DT4 TaxID=3393438 RepID=UPI003CEDF9E9
MNGYTWHWEVIWTADFLSLVLAGVKYVILVSAAALTIGSALGLVAAVGRTYRIPIVNQAAYLYVDFFRTTPLLVQLIWIFYVLPIILGFSLSAVTSGIIALSLNAGAYLSEIFRAGLVSIGRGQRDAAHVLGLSSRQTLRYILVPQALRRVLPATANVFITLVKESSILSVIAIPELTYAAQNYVTTTFRPLEVYTALAVLYFLLTYPLSVITTYLERRFVVP